LGAGELAVCGEPPLDGSTDIAADRDRCSLEGPLLEGLGWRWRLASDEPFSDIARSSAEERVTGERDGFSEDELAAGTNPLPYGSRGRVDVRGLFGEVAERLHHAEAGDAAEQVHAEGFGEVRPENRGLAETVHRGVRSDAHGTLDDSRAEAELR